MAGNSSRLRWPKELSPKPVIRLYPINTVYASIIFKILIIYYFVPTAKTAPVALTRNRGENHLCCSLKADAAGPEGQLL